MIRITQFQYTLEEFREGASAIENSAQKAKWNWSVGETIFLVIVIAFFALRFWVRGDPARRNPVQNTSGGGWGDLLLSLQPWVLVVVLVYFFVFRQFRRRHDRHFDSEPAFHEPRTFELDQTGVTMRDLHSRTTIEWPGFVRFLETPNLFILFSTENTGHLIPKRAFASPEDANHARDLFLNNIAPPTSAFPVIPAQAQSPTRP